MPGLGRLRVFADAQRYIHRPKAVGLGQYGLMRGTPPPEDAYGRVTNPERFRRVHDAADALVAPLESSYQVPAGEPPGGATGGPQGKAQHPRERAVAARVPLGIGRRPRR